MQYVLSAIRAQAELCAHTLWRTLKEILQPLERAWLNTFNDLRTRDQFCDAKVCVQIVFLPKVTFQYEL